MNGLDIPTLTSTALGAFIGSVLTLVATFVAHHLTSKVKDKKEKALLHGLLQGIHDEIETLWEAYLDSVGNRVETLGENQPLNFYWPVTQEYFTIYNNNAVLIGRIQDHDLRKEIVATYTKARGLIDSFRLNNELVNKYEYAYWLYQETNNEIHRVSVEAHQRSLVEYAKQLKKGHEEIKGKVSGLLRALRKQGVLSIANE